MCGGEISQVLETRVNLRRMPNPLPDSVASALRDPTSALAALMVIANAHRDLWAWASKAICSAGAEPEAPRRRAARRSCRANGAGHRQPRNKGDDPYLGRRLAKREADDQALVAAMKANPAGPIAAWAESIHKSRTSTVAGLGRLRAAGLAENSDKVWSLVETREPQSPPAKWIEPLGVRSHREHATA